MPSTFETVGLANKANLPRSPQNDPCEINIFLQNKKWCKLFLNYCQNTHNIRFMVLVAAATTITKYQRRLSTTVFLFPAHFSRNLQLIVGSAGGQKLAAAFSVTADTKIPVNTLN
jgi:hypothetical protein